jgi:hypothetical protein
MGHGDIQDPRDGQQQLATQKSGMIKRIDEAEKETHGGKFVRDNGENPPF